MAIMASSQVSVVTDSLPQEQSPRQSGGRSQPQRHLLLWILILCFTEPLPRSYHPEMMRSSEMIGVVLSGLAVAWAFTLVALFVGGIIWLLFWA